MASDPSILPYLKIRPPKGWAAFDLREVWRFRDLLIVLAGRDLKLRYRQTAIGVAWVLFQPLLAAGIFAFVFGTVAKLPTDGVPYFTFSFAGLVAWNLFSSTLLKASAAMVGNSQLVSKAYFPRLLLPLSSVPSSLVDFAVGAALMTALALVYRVVPGWPLLLLPVWVALLLSIAVGLGLVAGALMVRYRDVQHILPMLVPFLLYASPVGYPAAAVPARLGMLYFFNPLAGLLEGFRWSVLGTGSPPVASVAWSAATAVVALLAGLVVFKRMEGRFADVI